MAMRSPSRRTRESRISPGVITWEVRHGIERGDIHSPANVVHALALG
jgi:hypothetical protein